MELPDKPPDHLLFLHTKCGNRFDCCETGLVRRRNWRLLARPSFECLRGRRFLQSGRYRYVIGDSGTADWGNLEKAGFDGHFGQRQKGLGPHRHIQVACGELRGGQPAGPRVVHGLTSLPKNGHSVPASELNEPIALGSSATQQRATKSNKESEWRGTRS